MLSLLFLLLSVLLSAQAADVEYAFHMQLPQAPPASVAANYPFTFTVKGAAISEPDQELICSWPRVTARVQDGIPSMRFMYTRANYPTSPPSSFTCSGTKANGQTWQVTATIDSGTISTPGTFKTVFKGWAASEPFVFDFTGDHTEGWTYTKTVPSPGAGDSWITGKWTCLKGGAAWDVKAFMVRDDDVSPPGPWFAGVVVEPDAAAGTGTCRFVDDNSDNYTFSVKVER